MEGHCSLYQPYIHIISMLHIGGDVFSHSGAGGSTNGSGICIPMDLGTYNDLSSHSLTLIVCYIHCMVDLLKKLGI
jgi:hypothetical protein